MTEQTNETTETGKPRAYRMQNRQRIKTTQLQLRIDPNFKARLAQQAAARGVNVTRLVEMAIENFLENGIDAAEQPR